MKRIAAILLWAVIAAAFVGPGTVTTCAKAGAEHGLTLLWALLFSTFGCVVLQEAAARIAIVSGQDLAAALRERVGGVSVLLVVGAILVGCAAYEAGNIVGATVGADMTLLLDRRVWVLAIAVAAALTLFSGSAGGVSRAMGIVVALMGLAFALTALRVAPNAGEVASGLVVPQLPDGSTALVIALVGTTIVPYNLFLGSGLARNARLADVRLGLVVAVGLGGLISMAVVVVGTAVDPPFAFDALASTLAATFGDGARTLFGLGLLAAGFSSAVTAPLAAAVTARGLFGNDAGAWADRGVRFRLIWILVLGVGIAFGLLELRPVPVIVLAQALNGLLLPVAAGFLLLLVNDRRVMGAAINGAAGNVAIAATFAIAVLLGVTNLLRAATRVLNTAPPDERTILGAAAILTVAAVVPLSLAALRRRS